MPENLFIKRRRLKARKTSIKRRIEAIPAVRVSLLEIAPMAKGKIKTPLPIQAKRNPLVVFGDEGKAPIPREMIRGNIPEKKRPTQTRTAPEISGLVLKRKRP